VAGSPSALAPAFHPHLQFLVESGPIITGKASRRGSFTSVKELVQKIDHFVAHYNQNCKPFNWTATADSILAKLNRLCERISGTGH
jgi:putative transposase